MKNYTRVAATGGVIATTVLIATKFQPVLRLRLVLAKLHALRKFNQCLKDVGGTTIVSVDLAAVEFCCHHKELFHQMARDLHYPDDYWDEFFALQMHEVQQWAVGLHTNFILRHYLPYYEEAQLVKAVAEIRLELQTSDQRYNFTTQKLRTSGLPVDIFIEQELQL